MENFYVDNGGDLFRAIMKKLSIERPEDIGINTRTSFQDQIELEVIRYYILNDYPLELLKETLIELQFQKQDDIKMFLDRNYESICLLMVNDNFPESFLEKYSSMLIAVMQQIVPEKLAMKLYEAMREYYRFGARSPMGLCMYLLNMLENTMQNIFKLERRQRVVIE
ncbi:hypothetical protein [Liquorilactobacillus hordei]|uniref:Uncharacterized protein n=1 Tax=Liquorilactobacillus hordei DSM 19519 TaxID=1423759 RepID=A0A0R1MJ60_9LACO|nr:hypothetical protein [Liquorilactobacillus hordei]KRL08032.1 hypothetical protein FC92_GL001105 [Liquorilactobacillus hordei DSM 19519]QYH51024.1 hypothetical protein G6O70_00215 [Liquorilactobacillus hordei DSM 19519]